MPERRNDSFHLALAGLRERLHDGDLAPGARIAATEVAIALRLSPTPVREALARLAGEGLIEDRRGQGYFVRTLTALDIADLHRLSLACLSIPLAPDRPAAPVAAVVLDKGLGGRDPVRRVEHIFGAWVRQAGGRTLATVHHRLTAQLAPVRRAERLLFSDLVAEAAELAEAIAAPHWVATVERYHARRIAAADQLASLAEARASASEV